MQLILNKILESQNMNLADQHNRSNKLQLEQFHFGCSSVEVCQKWLKEPNPEVFDIQVDLITSQVFRNKW